MNIPEGWPTDDMLFAAREACDDMFQTDFIRAFKAALAAAPTPPAQEDEPVLWLCDFDDQTWYAPNKEGADRYKAEGGATVTPLYTRPENSTLRKAAEEVIKILEFHGEYDYTKNLRAALEGK